MPFKLPLRSDFERVFKNINGRPHDRGLDGVTARVVGKSTRGFVEQFEYEHRQSTPVEHFISAEVAAVSNVMAGLIRYCIQGGKQRQTLDVLLNTIREQAAARLDVDASVPVFFPGLDPDAGERNKGDRK